MIDILITTYNRLNFLKKTVESLITKNKTIRYRLFIIDDHSTDQTADYLKSLNLAEGSIVLSKKRMGVVYGFNLLWTMAEYYNRFVEEFPYLCYLQDDVESLKEEWLATLIDYYQTYVDKENISFASGYDAPQHPVIQTIKNGNEVIYLKRSTSFQNILALKSYWRSIGLVPKYNPDGSPRGFPNNGRGSHIDLYFTGCKSSSIFVKGASATNSSYLENKKILVIPNLVQHLGLEPHQSTWRYNR